MRIFDTNGKTNFVDDNNVFVGFDAYQSCCESFGWRLSKERPTDTDTEGEDGNDHEGFQFDTEFFEDASHLDSDAGGAVTFRLVKGDEELFLTLWNHHNGYYSHGFEMRQGDLLIREDYI